MIVFSVQAVRLPPHPEGDSVTQRHPVRVLYVLYTPIVFSVQAVWLPPHPEGDSVTQRHPVWVLHARVCHEHGKSTRGKPQTNRRGHREKL